MPNTKSNKTFAQIYDSTLGRLVTRMIRRAAPTTNDPQVIMAPLSVGTDEIGEVGDIIHTGSLRTDENHTVGGDVSVGKNASVVGNADIGGIVNIGKRATIFGPLLVNSSAALGYATGAGAAVTQGASLGKGTTVTLNSPVGQITMNNGQMAAGGLTSFTLINSYINTSDLVVVNVASGTGPYRAVAQVAGGSAVILVQNHNAGALSEALLVNFAVVRGTAS